TVGIAWRCSPIATSVLVALQLVSAAVTAFGLLGFAQVLTGVLESTDTTGQLLAALPALATVAGCYALAGLATVGADAAQARLAPGVRRLAEDALVTATADTELIDFDDAGFYDALVRARDRGVDALGRAVIQLARLCAASISLLAMGSVVGTLHPLLLLALLASVLPSGWATVRAARMGYSMVLRTMPTRRRMGQLRDLLTEREPAAEVRSYTAQAALLGRYRDVAARLERIEVRLGLRQNWVDTFGRSLSGVGMAVAYGLLVWLVMAGAVAVGGAAAMLVAIQAARSSLAQAAYMMNLLYEQSLYVKDYGAFRREAEARRRAAQARALGPAPVLSRSIEVCGVSFRYPGADVDALRDIDLTIPRGKVLALVGENGSGKSTLAKLLAGLYRPRVGTIRWDGVDLAMTDPDSVRSQIALVPQRSTNWPLTAEQNITIGRPYESEPDRDRLAEVAAESGADSVIAGLSAGGDTLLSKEFRGGAELSTGQWQRLAMARALYRDAPVLICDEPTAPLDARAEALVYDALRRLAGGRTVILITHRLASVRMADQIIVLADGRIVERGRHEELVNAAGHYAELYALQASLSADVASVAGAPPSL
ncbi:MAG TPA: ATP-binding cassette domain-containing protein, partial [Nonomuraea sp.]|nr:ATP-binding cassette domain-containing protein [Nonomuraea sp.]